MDRKGGLLGGTHAQTLRRVARKAGNADRVGTQRPVHREVGAEHRRWLVLDVDREATICPADLDWLAHNPASAFVDNFDIDRVIVT